VDFQADKTKEKGSDDEDAKTEKNIDSKQKKFDQEQHATIEKSDITTPTGGYHDKAQKVY
jgi:hypothetical protein